MPYKIKGKCIYKKNTDKKVGCTKGSVKKYMAALHANVKESLNECYDLSNVIINDGAHKATVLFTLTKSPGAEITLVYDLSNPTLPPDYIKGMIKDSQAKKMFSFKDPQKAKRLLKKYGITPHDVEGEMCQQGVEQINSKLKSSKTDDGVQKELLQFENLFDKIINS